MDQPISQHDSLIAQRCVRVRERERESEKMRGERKLFCQDLRVLCHYPARLSAPVCRLLPFLSLSGLICSAVQPSNGTVHANSSG